MTRKALPATADRVPYSHFDHRHNFAVWAAARAAQRAFTTTDNLRDAIENCGVVDYVRDHSTRSLTKKDFNARHREWCRSIVSYLTSVGVRKETTFGRATKLVAVYLKAMVVLGPDCGSDLAKVAHPPIDRILLQNLAAVQEISTPHQSKWRQINWTSLEEGDYYQLLAQLADCLDQQDPLWMLEQHWTVTKRGPRKKQPPRRGQDDVAV